MDTNILVGQRVDHALGHWLGRRCTTHSLSRGGAPHHSPRPPRDAPKEVTKRGDNPLSRGDNPLGHWLGLRCNTPLSREIHNTPGGRLIPPRGDNPLFYPIDYMTK